MFVDKATLRGQSVGGHGRNSLPHCVLVFLPRIKGEDVLLHLLLSIPCIIDCSTVE